MARATADIDGRIREGRFRAPGPSPLENARQALIPLRQLESDEREDPER